MPSSKQSPKAGETSQSAVIVVIDVDEIVAKTKGRATTADGFRPAATASASPFPHTESTCMHPYWCQHVLRRHHDGRPRARRPCGTSTARRFAVVISLYPWGWMMCTTSPSDNNLPRPIR